MTTSDNSTAANMPLRRATQYIYVLNPEDGIASEDRTYTVRPITGGRWALEIQQTTHRGAVPETTHYEEFDVASLAVEARSEQIRQDPEAAGWEYTGSRFVDVDEPTAALDTSALMMRPGWQPASQAEPGEAAPTPAAELAAREDLTPADMPEGTIALRHYDGTTLRFDVLHQYDDNGDYDSSRVAVAVTAPNGKELEPFVREFDTPREAAEYAAKFEAMVDRYPPVPAEQRAREQDEQQAYLADDDGTGHSYILPQPSPEVPDPPTADQFAALAAAETTPTAATEPPGQVFTVELVDAAGHKLAYEVTRDEDGGACLTATLSGGEQPAEVTQYPFADVETAVDFYRDTRATAEQDGYAVVPLVDDDQTPTTESSTTEAIGDDTTADAAEDPPSAAAEQTDNESARARVAGDWADAVLRLDKKSPQRLNEMETAAADPLAHEDYEDQDRYTDAEVSEALGFDTGSYNLTHE